MSQSLKADYSLSAIKRSIGSKEKIFEPGGSLLIYQSPPKDQKEDGVIREHVGLVLALEKIKGVDYILLANINHFSDVTMTGLLSDLFPDSPVISDTMDPDILEQPVYDGGLNYPERLFLLGETEHGDLVLYEDPKDIRRFLTQNQGGRFLMFHGFEALEREKAIADIKTGRIWEWNAHPDLIFYEGDKWDHMQRIITFNGSLPATAMRIWEPDETEQREPVKIPVFARN